MHLLNNQLCLFLILCLCKQIYAIYMYAKNWACTPDLPAMIIVQHCSHSKQISSSRNICNIFLVYRFSDYISSLSNHCMCPEGNLDSCFGVLKFLCCYFKPHANYQLTNEIASFVINYSNKALSNQRPVPKSRNYPCDLNKDYASNSQTFSRAFRRE
jgi:hypothetical protein